MSVFRRRRVSCPAADLGIWEQPPPNTGRFAPPRAGPTRPGTRVRRAAAPYVSLINPGAAGAFYGQDLLERWHVLVLRNCLKSFVYTSRRGRPAGRWEASLPYLSFCLLVSYEALANRVCRRRASLLCVRLRDDALATAGCVHSELPALRARAVFAAPPTSTARYSIAGAVH